MIYKTVFTVFSIISVILISCQPIPPDLMDSPGALTVIRMTTIKAEPSFNASDIATVNPDAQLVWIYSQGEWYRVRLHNGQEGWIHRTLVKTTTYKTGTIRERIELREQPYDGSAITQIIPAGSSIKILQESNEWVMIRPTNYNNVGWVSRSALNRALQGSAISIQSGAEHPDLYMYNATNVLIFTDEESNIRSGPSTSTPIVTRVQRGTRLGWNSTVGSWYRITISSTQQQGYIYRPLVTEEPFTTIHTNQECNLRAGPGTNYMQIDRIQPNTSLILLNTYQDWYLVQKNTGELAWIRSDLTDYAAYGTSFGTDFEEITPLSGKLNFGFYYTNKATNVYSTPKITSRLVATLHAGQKIDVVRMSSNDWYEVRFGNNQRGYISKDDIVSIRQKPVTTMSSVNFRQSPNTQSQIIKRLKPGTLLQLTDVQASWCKVRTGSDDGWVAGIYIIPRKNRSLFVNKENSELRANPQTNSPVVYSIPQGEEIYFYKKLRDWYQFKTYDNDVNVWINESEVSVPAYGYGVALEPSSIYQGPNTYYPTHTTKLLEGVDVPVLKHSLSWFQIMVPGKRKMGWVPEDIIHLATMRPLILLKTAAIFTSQDEESTIIDMLQPGTELIEIQPIDDWHQVKIQDGPVGWVKDTEVATTKYGNITIRRNTALRYGPGNEYAIKSNMASRTTVFVLDRQDDWVQIDNGIVTGWILDR